MSIVFQLAACAVLYGWLEYIVHRWDMHKFGSYRFKSHTVEHHGQMHMGVEQASLTQTNAGTAFWFTLPLTLPVAWFWGWSFLACWAATCLWGGFAWTAVHRHIHGERGYWYAWLLCPWLSIVRANHLRHHANPRCRFGGMFWFLTDPIAGTLK